MNSPKPITRTARRGATLVEVSVSTLLVGVVLAAALETVGGAMRTTRQTTAAVDACELAELMLAEAIALPYEDPDGDSVGIGQESGEPTLTLDRIAADDLDDLDGYSRTPPEHRDGTPVAGYAGWAQLFRVRYVQAERAAGGGLPNTANDEGLKRIRVELTDPSGDTWNFYTIRSAYGAADTAAPFDATRVTAVEVTAEVGGAAAIHKSAAVTNLAETP